MDLAHRGQVARPREPLEPGDRRMVVMLCAVRSGRDGTHTRLEDFLKWHALDYYD